MLRHVVGIDLGTTHCVVASAELTHPEVTLFDVPQLVAPGEVAARQSLPSFLYLPAPGELAEHDRALPWDGASPPLVGELARRLGSQAPDRLVASAKSWICHGGVNRRAPILPWSAPDGAPHLSPFDASVSYLAHLRAAWDRAHPGAPLAEQDVVVTVPASFDDDARELTLAAAKAAGLGEVRLLEEPQAAFYDFCGELAHDLGAQLGGSRLVLVVDVGGGTTDLTLLAVRPAETEGGPPQLERIAVGGHLLLGGDNMDAALAHRVLELAGLTERLEPARWSALVQASRAAKETLLAANAPLETTLTITPRGSRLIGGARSVALSRDEARRVLVDGFFPFTGPAEEAARTARAGLTTLGLPYVTDPAVPRHVCTFLRKHVEASRAVGARIVDGLPRPDRLLLNGGVFNAPALADRLAAALAGWFGGEPVPLLAHTSLDAAVARGAARFALTRHGVGEVITGGSARSYWLGIEDVRGQRRAMCVAPRGLAEGATVTVPDRVFELVLDRPVVFPLYSSTTDETAPPGSLAPEGAELEPLPPVQTVLRERAGAAAGTRATVPVRLSATLAESGALELWLVGLELPPRRWRLELELQSPPAPDVSDDAGRSRALPGREATEPSRGSEVQDTSQARRLLASALSASSDDGPRGARTELEALLGPRGAWSAAVCRALADELLAHEATRARSAQHELHWLRLASWCLRPGAGAPGDVGRVRRVWGLHDGKLRHPSKATWPEWWILWRRVAAGLGRPEQEALFADVSPWLAPAANAPPGPRAHGELEMLQLLAALERLPRALKERAGEWFLARTVRVTSWWPLGRLGAREPLHGEPRETVGRELAAEWLVRLLALDWKRAEGAAFAAALLARMTGDPARDLDEASRAEVARRLREHGAPASWVDLVTRPTALSSGDEGRMLGDALPAGLRLR